MFNIADRLYSWKEHSCFAKSRGPLLEQIHEVKTKEPIKTIGIIPTAILSRKSLLTRIMGTKGTHYLYPVSALYHMTSDAQETVRNVEKVYQRAREEVRRSYEQEEKIHLVAASLGTAIMSRIAQEFPHETLTLIVPGDRLGACALESSLKGPIARRTPSHEHYCEILSSFDPIDHVEQYQVQSKVRVFVGGKDLLIPGWRGKRLAEKIKEKRPSAEVHYYPYADHFFTIWKASNVLSKLSNHNP